MKKIFACILLLASLGCVTEKVDTRKSRNESMASVQWKGQIDREQVRKSIRLSLTDIKKCYEKQLKISPKAKGEIVVELIFGSEGQVQNSRVLSSTIPTSERMGACMLAGLEKVKYPKAEDGFASVAYPFVFAPPKR
jgi:hypothetical protein